MKGLPFHVMQEMLMEQHDDMFLETARECTRILIDNGYLHKRSEIRKMDTIDMSAYGMAHSMGDEAALPIMNMSDDEKDKLKENWCLGIPPLLNGVLRVNKQRFIGYKIQNIDLENKSYDIEMMDYGFDKGTWAFNVLAWATVQCKEHQPYGYTFNYVMTMEDLFRHVFVDPPKGMNKLPLDKKYYDNLVNEVLPSLQEVKAENDMAFNTLNHFFIAMIRVNCELNEHKPKAVRSKAKGTKYKVTTVTDEVPEKDPKPQIVRTLPSGITIKSVKVPKASTLEVVRHYKVASWNVRGHMRHYKNGKTVYIEPKVHKRKEFENTTNVSKRQTIIVSERTV